MTPLPMFVQEHITGSLGLVNFVSLSLRQNRTPNLELVLTYFGTPSDMVNDTLPTPKLFETNSIYSTVNIPSPDVLGAMCFELM